MGEKRTRLAVVVATGFDEYQNRIMRGLHPVLAERGIVPVLHANDPFVDGLSGTLISVLRDARPCGIVAMNCMTPKQEVELIDLLDELARPTVCIGLVMPGMTCVRGDNLTGMRELMGHLLDGERVRRPVFIRGIPAQPDSLAREQVFCEELDRRGLGVDERLMVTGNFSQDVSYQEMQRLLAKGLEFDAVVAANDVSALGALAALNDHGLAVPGDVRLAGFDNTQASALTWPGLTTVDQGLQDQGRIAAEHLIQEIDGTHTCGEVFVPSHVVIRGSSSPGHATLRPGATMAVTMAKASQAQLAGQDAVIGLNRALLRCKTVEDIVDVLSVPRQLHRLGLARCFLAIYAPPPGDGSPDPAGSPGARDAPDPQDPTGTYPKRGDGRTRWARLVLDHRDDTRHPAPDDVFPVHRLLPEALRTQLDTGGLVLQPLSVGDHPLGYVLFEQVGGMVTVTEVLRMDLSRTIGAVRASQELREYATNLEVLVAGRTRALEEEVYTRRQTERDLHAEVLIRRQAEQELQRMNAQLQRSAVLDGLTGVGNRAAFTQHLELHWPGPCPDDALTLIMIDVDFFKAYNDHFGHVCGDEALRVVADCLERALCQDDDLAARYGGEEFAALLPRSDLVAGLTVADRFRRLLAEVGIPHPTSTVAPVVTASLGIAQIDGRTRDTQTPDDLVRAADRALYRAKAEGRNRVVVEENIVANVPRPAPEPDVSTRAQPGPATHPVPGPRVRPRRPWDNVSTDSGPTARP